MILSEDLQIVSPQTAKDKGLFGPIYHGTTSDKLEKISSHGFNVFVGHERSGDVSQGYQASDYYGGIPAPIHHLGFGVYFTTVQAIAKKFSEGSNKIGPYFIDTPRMETINFGSPRTMMKWWLENGYDYKKSPETLFGTGQTNLSLIRQERLRATQNMTNFLKAKYDAIWYKGKGMYKLLDGDQVVVFDPNKIYKVNKDMAQPDEIGSKVVAKVGIDTYGREEIKIPIGTKGVIIDKKKPMELQKWAEGSEWIYHIKWEKGGVMWDVLDKWIEPYTKKRKVTESIEPGLDLGSFDEDYKLTYQQMYNELNVEKLSTQRWIKLSAKEIMRVWFTYVKYGRVDKNDILRIWYRTKDIALRSLVASHIFNQDGPPIFNSKSFDQLSYEDDDKLTQNIFKFIGTEKQTFGGQDLLENLIKKAYKSRNPDELLISIDQLLNFVHDAGDMGDIFIEGGRRTLDRISRWKPKGIHLKGKLSEGIQEKPYYPITKENELAAINQIERTWGKLIGKTLHKTLEERHTTDPGVNYFSDRLTYEFTAIDNKQPHRLFLSSARVGILFRVINLTTSTIVLDWRFVDGKRGIKENKEEKPYYQISKIEEEKAVHYIQKNWDKRIGKTLHKTMDTRREEDSESFKDILRYEGNTYSGRTIRFYFEKFKGSLYYKAVGNDGEFLNSWTLIPDSTINENIDKRPYYHISKREESEAVNWIQKEWFWLIGKTLSKRSEDRKEDAETHFFDFMSFKADVSENTLIKSQQLFFYLEKTEQGIHYMVLNDTEDKIIRRWSDIPITLDPIQENTKKQEIYHHINRVTEQQCINYINKEWGDIIGKTLTKFREGRRLQSIENNLLDTIEYMASDKEGFSLLFTIQSTVTNTIDMFVATSRSVKYGELGGWDKIPNASPEKLNESKQTSKVHYKLSREAELQAIHHIQRDLQGMIGKTLKKHSERRDEYRNWGIIDIIIYEAKNKISGEKMFIYIQSTPDGGVAYEGINRVDGKDYPWSWEIVPGAESTLVNESVDKVPYYPITKMEEHQALDVLLKTRKHFQYKEKRTFRKIADDRHVRVPTYFVDQIKYEVIVDGKRTIVSLEKAQDGMMYYLSYLNDDGNHNHHGWDWVDPRKSQIQHWLVITENKNNEPIYEGKFELTKMEEQEVINHINKLYHKQIGKTLRKIGESWSHEHHDIHVKKLIYKANYSGDNITIYINKTPRGKIQYFMTGDTTKIFSFYPPEIGENIEDDNHKDALNKTGFWGTKGAGAIILARNTGRILLSRRSADVEQPHTWGVWGGAIDSNEDPVVAVKRELGEELGYHGLDSELIPLYIYKHPSGFQYHNFLAIVPQEFVPKLDWETEGYRWVTFGEWPVPLHFGLKSLLQNDGDKILSIIQKLKVVPLKKEKVDKEKYKAAIHLIRLVWEDMRKAGAYKDRFDFDNEFVHWMLNSEPLQNLTEKYGTLFYPNAHEPGHEFQRYVEQVLESLEIKHNDNRSKNIDTSDPLFLLKQVVRGKTWENSKQEIRKLTTSGGKYEPRAIGDDEAESLFNRVYRIALGETFWSETEMSQYRPLSSYILSANSPENEVIFFRYYNNGPKFPDNVKVYRGLNSPILTIRPGDHVSFDKGFARGYEAGKYGAVISAVLPSKDLLVKRMDVNSTELVYWPPGHKIQEVENVPTFKQFYNQWAFP